MVRYLTEQDILDAASRDRRIVLEPGARLTPLAQDAARQLGLEIVWAQDDAAGTAAPASEDAEPEPDLRAIIRAAVIARLGAEPDGLDAILAGVLDGLEGLD
ncbi:MAG TPA: hypothetical protein EYP25_05560 [Anaerolineae bacterium]|nr:hypothetical protein [Caldilineae bacterium]HID34030.1 hypothetical protein [Anaerolineae bacterium]HIQ11839.1 hypothetical protein [Caldilineales bacterium]